MNNPQTSSASPIPPPPSPPAGSGRGCLKVGMIGCGVVGLLGIIGIVAMALWWNRNSGEITSRAGEAVREGARYGLASDEAGCFETARRRIGTDPTVAGTFAVGAYARACLEYSRETPGFCENVPPMTAIRRTAEWNQQRCGTDAGCRHVSQVVQQYCTEGRTKRTAADTLLMTGAGTPPAGSAPPAAGGAEPDSNSF